MLSSRCLTRSAIVAMTMVACVAWTFSALADPLPPSIHCSDTGGEWVECGSGCGPFTCDNPDPGDFCPEVCVEQCVCPEGEVWGPNGGCILLADCSGGNGAPPAPFTDNDGDGTSLEQGDCDDSNDTVYPSAPELCDGIDNDCNGLVDDECDPLNPEEVLCDNTGGLWNECGSGCGPFTCDNPVPWANDCPEECITQCDCPPDHVWDSAVGCISVDDCDEPSTDEDGDGWSVEDGDCDDANADVYPTATETCDGLDNNCDGVTDDGCDETDPDEALCVESGGTWQQVDDCGEGAECPSLCVCPSDTDCWDGDQGCHACPVEEPSAVVLLCADSGGTWNECGSGCGPFTCDNPGTDPDVACITMCVPQCECPADQVWETDMGCIALTDCEGDSPGPDVPPVDDDDGGDDTGGGSGDDGGCSQGPASAPNWAPVWMALLVLLLIPIRRRMARDLRP